MRYFSIITTNQFYLLRLMPTLPTVYSSLPTSTYIS